jgi:cytochrome b561
MLQFLNIAQVVLYVAMLALLGQGLLFVLAGAKRDSNFFYKLLQVISKPFTLPMRKVTPRQVADEHVPLITFFLLLVISFTVFVERGYLMCEQLGYTDCRG